MGMSAWEGRPGRRKAVFLDRDGTLVHDVGYLRSPADIRLYPDAVESLLALGRQGYLLFVLTNQAGIAEGRLTRSEVDAVHRALEATLASAGVRIERFYVCPHRRQDGCDCIKPRTRWVTEAAQEYDLDLERCFVVGDHPHDPATADGVGAFGLYLLTGHGQEHLDQLPDHRLVFHSLGDASRWMLAHPEPGAMLQAAVERAAAAIRAGGLAAFPTETVYGLGANALDPVALARIFELKRRPLADPLIVHLAGLAEVETLAASVPPEAHRLMDAYWPGPLTIVLPKRPVVPDLATAGLDTVALRMPSARLARELIRLAGVPVAAPSANRFGCTSPTTAAHVVEQLGTGWGEIVDGGACRVGLESTVVALARPGGPAELLRPGAVTREMLEAVAGPVVVSGPAADLPDGPSRPGPGMYRRHYAPATPLVLVGDASPYLGRPDLGVLLFAGRGRDAGQGPQVEVLSPTGDPREAAVNLYAAIRRLDAMGLRAIMAEEAPGDQLGAAINDRLRKASHRA